ncbi:Exoribonuclease, phosphorolytic domain 1,Exoribonuclease, phosphorolytic domain 2,Ribosomal [Cinara cedri]|uniref:Exoribonuclease, phosphorolytic domain 1,Exoribonuclease, phosphorolytic domain 2,Ribosomal n=1 Tax=Cinara cedri TaxID=506608 RepID=A0A5E4MV79_9HEMI|nr:Exoribonuclease, phosphorolytic domain 1,Exoribonuclease, phosphorolytic domain 2,Ribosomal [Cinara cedri]
MNSPQCKLGYLGNTEGSAFFSQGKTAVCVSVVGPFEPKASKSMYDRATVDVTFRRKTGSISVHDKMLEGIMQSTCEIALNVEQYPRTSIVVTVQEMQDRGNLLSTCLNASCMALIDSGIAMHHLYAAVSCAVTESEEIILDPDELQINSSVAYFTLVFSNSETRRLLTSHTTGEFSHSTYVHCMDKCFAASKEIFNFYKNIVKKSSIFN